MAQNGVETDGKPARSRHNITLDELARKRGEDMATEDLRSFSNFLEWLVEQEWKRRFGPKPEDSNKQKEFGI